MFQYIHVKSIKLSTYFNTSIKNSYNFSHISIHLQVDPSIQAQNFTSIFLHTKNTKVLIPNDPIKSILTHVSHLSNLDPAVVGSGYSMEDKRGQEVGLLLQQVALCLLLPAPTPSFILLATCRAHWTSLWSLAWWSAVPAWRTATWGGWSGWSGVCPG